jgi:hypothetical protein
MARQITVEILGNAKGFTDATQDAIGATGRMKNVLAGVGLGIGESAWNLATDAVGQFVDGLGDAKQAYLDDVASQDKLAAAMKANVQHQRATTAAIEEVIAARMRLGWSDDQQRDSLAELVAITKDEGKALDLQRQAMDLARLKGMDLGTASEILGKVYGGNTGILSRYGIQLKKGASATEALAAIQAMAGGQAEAYAEGPLGKQEAAEIRVGEAMERVGKIVADISAVVLPMAADAFEWLAGVIGDVWEAIGPTVTAFVEGLQPALAALQPVVVQLGTIFGEVMANISAVVQGAVAVLTEVWNTFGANITAAIGTAFAFVQETIGNALAVVQGIWDTFAALFAGDWSAVWEGVQAVFAAIWDQIRNVFDTITGLIGNALDAFGKLVGDAWDGILKTIGDGIATFVGFFTDLPGQIGKAVGGLFDGIPDAFRRALNWVIGIWNGLGFTLGPFNLGPLGTIGPWSLGTPDLPYFHQGGVVPGAAGSDVLAVLQAGERVIPRGGGGGGTLVIEVNGVSVLTPGAAERLAELVAPVVTRWQQGRGVYGAG